LKLYIYGYLNRVQSSRRLERDAGRNVEVMWLTGRLVPDHKTIADFRKDNGPAIRKVCARFVELCREIGLLTKASVAIDGNKFKAVNNRDRNFTRAKVERRRAQLEESVAQYLSQLDTADRQEPSETLALKTTRLKEKLAKLESQMQRLAAIEKQMLASPDQQISLTDPDSRSMATSGRGSGVVGYNVQVAVDTENHLIVTHEVTNVGSDRSQLATVAKDAKATLQTEKLEAVADRGYFNGEEILACEEAGITVTLPKPMTSNSKAEGRFGKQDFRYVAEEDVYILSCRRKAQHRNGPARAGLQSHARHEHCGPWTTSRSDQGLAPAQKPGSHPALGSSKQKNGQTLPGVEQMQSSRASSPRTPDRSPPSVFTRPRPRADIKGVERRRM